MQRAHVAASRWPAVLRWLERINLESLERIVLRSRVLQKFVLRVHRRAFERLLKNVPEARQIGVVGGALVWLLLCAAVLWLFSYFLPAAFISSSALGIPAFTRSSFSP